MDKIRYRLIQDNDSHWYLIPVDKAAAFEAWVQYMESDSDDEFAGEDFEDTAIGGSPGLVSFLDPRVK